MLPLFLFCLFFRHRSPPAPNHTGIALCPVHIKLVLHAASASVSEEFTLYLLWCVLSVSIIIECVAKTWQVWLVAKLIAGMGVGTLRELISS